MSMPSMQILSRYHYDPLDRLVIAGPSQRFYQAGYLATELDDQGLRSIMRHAAQPLAQQRGPGGAGATTLLATDLAQSPLLTLTGALMQRLSYTGYGYAPAESGLSRLLGFNGECPDRITGHYLLGNGKRAFNPVLMRFNSPDELSPFEEGGLNAYVYCAGDPINFSDPTGNVRFKLHLMRMNAQRPTVIVQNPTYKLKTTAATIDRDSPHRTSPPPNHLLGASATSAPVGLRAKPPEYKTVPALRETFTRHRTPGPNSNPSPQNRQRVKAHSDLIQVAENYDSHVVRHPTFIPIAPGGMVDKLSQLQTNFVNAKPENRMLAGAKLRRLELQLKKYVYMTQIRQLS